MRENHKAKDKAVTAPRAVSRRAGANFVFAIVMIAAFCAGAWQLPFLSALGAGGADGADSANYANGADGAISVYAASGQNGQDNENADSRFESLFMQPGTAADDDGMQPRADLTPESAFDTSDLPVFDAEAYILLDRRSGLTIASKDPEKRLYPASTTKIMTAALALEMGRQDDMFTASAQAIRDVGEDGSNIGIIAGETMRLDNLLDALMVKSANEASNIIAEGLCGERSQFINLMNERAAELGARDTHFVNASGYHDDNHYTTAYDLALIANHAMDNPAFREIVSQRTIDLAPTNKHESWERMWSTNQLIVSPAANTGDYSVTGVKTGFTTPAGYCLVATATSGDGMELLCVVLGVKGDSASARRFDITTSLLEYGFEKFTAHTFVTNQELIESVSVIGGTDADSVDAVASGSIKLFLPSDADSWNISRITHIQPEVAAPVVVGEKLGYIEYRNNGRFAGMVNVVASADIAEADGGPFEIPKRKDTGAARDGSKALAESISRQSAGTTAPVSAQTFENGAENGSSPANDGAAIGSAPADETARGQNSGAEAPVDNAANAADAARNGSVGSGDNSDAAETKEKTTFVSILAAIGKIALFIAVGLAILLSAIRTYNLVSMRNARRRRLVERGGHTGGRGNPSGRGSTGGRGSAVGDGDTRGRAYTGGGYGGDGRGGYVGARNDSGGGGGYSENGKGRGYGGDSGYSAIGRGDVRKNSQVYESADERRDGGGRGEYAGAGGYEDGYGGGYYN